jgi:phospholipase D1/2
MTPMPQSLFRPGENCCAVAHASRVSMVVDGEAYFDAFAQAAERSERSIMLLAWDFDSRTALRFGADGKPLETLGDLLNRLCRAKPRLRVYILDWDFPMVYGTDREYSPIFGLNWEPHRHIQFRFDDTHPLAGSHHQKIAVFDDRLAFAGGLDITNKRWDSPTHGPDDPRRTFEDKPYPPFHDAMMAVDGEAAVELAKIARERWRKATGQRLKPVKTSVDPWGELRVDMADVNVGIACTYPPAGDTEGVHHVEALYLDMIARARDYIYIENQYFTSEKVGLALQARLGDPNGPEIFLATRLLSHGWLEEMTMHVLRTRLVRQLRAADTHGRFHAYFPHVEGLCEGTCLDLHSKVMIVDDEWLRVGSSNLSNRSMGVDTECDVTVEAQGNVAVRAAIRTVRDKLLAEHSGVDVEVLRPILEQAGSIAAAVEQVGTPARQLRRLEAPEVSEALMAAAAIGDMENPISLDALVDDFASDDLVEMAPTRTGPWALVGAFTMLVAFALAWRYTPLAQVVTAESVLGVIQEFSRHWWAPVLLVAAYTPASLVMFPRPLITFAAVVTFGPWEGLTYAMAGVLLAALAGYAAGRLFHRDTARRLAGPRLTRLSALLKRRGVVAIALVRLVPIAPYLVVNVVMGAMRIRLADYLGGTFLGMLPGALAATVLSDQIAAALQDPARVNGWMVAGAVGVVAAMAFFGHRMLRRMGARDLAPPASQTAG